MKCKSHLLTNHIAHRVQHSQQHRLLIITMKVLIPGWWDHFQLKICKNHLNPPKSEEQQREMMFFNKKAIILKTTSLQFLLAPHQWDNQGMLRLFTLTIQQNLHNLDEILGNLHFTELINHRIRKIEMTISESDSTMQPIQSTDWEICLVLTLQLKNQ